MLRWDTHGLHRSILSVMLFAVLLSGCGGESGPARYDISGKVTFDGKPIPQGSIAFQPVDGGIGGGFAIIQDGQYDTSQGGRGHLGGSHKVVITGTDGTPVNAADPDAGMIELFPAYETTHELPEESGTQDFDVPAG